MAYNFVLTFQVTNASAINVFMHHRTYFPEKSRAHENENRSQLIFTSGQA